MITNRTSSFQGLRVLFILSIIFMHAGMKVFGEGGELCSFFFVVSGFLLAGKDVQTVSYARKKLWAMYPVYLIFLVVYVALDSLFTRHVAIQPNIVPHLLLLQSWTPRFYPINNLGPAWFLSSLMFCYVCAPTINRWIGKQSKRKQSTILVVLAAVFLVHFFPPVKRLFSGDGYTWLIYFSPVFRLIEYTMGLVLGWILRGSPCRKDCTAVSLLVLILYGWCIYAQVLGNKTTLLHLGFIAYAYCYRSVVINAVLGNRVMKWLARYSLFFYLGHFPFVTLVRRQYDLPPILSVLLALVLVSVITILYRTYYPKRSHIHNTKN